MTEPIDRFLVIHEYTCPACGGSGYMTEEQFLAAQEAAANAGWNALSTFWRERGYYSSTRWPPEEYLCKDCNGERLIRADVNLADALKELERRTP